MPAIADFFSQRPNLICVAKQLLVPLLLKFNEDTEQRVREIAQTSLLSFFKKKLIDQSMIEECIQPFVIDKAMKGESAQLRCEGVTLMCQLAELDPGLGNRFLRAFTELVWDSTPFVRKACAEGMVKFSVLGVYFVEKTLLPWFLQLCADSCWIVRKACALSLLQFVSCLSGDNERIVISKAHVKLLEDEYRWVRLSAYQDLGKVIACYAEPSHLSQPSFACASSESDSDSEEEKGQQLCNAEVQICDTKCSPETSCTENGDSSVCQPPKDDSVFYCFSYWSLPLPEIEVESMMENLDISESTPNQLPSVEKCDRTSDNLTVKTSESVSQVQVKQIADITFHKHGRRLDHNQCGTGINCVVENNDSIYAQDVVPPELLGAYVSMVSPLTADVDSELAVYCASDFVAVTKALGPANWHCLKHICSHLASDKQWKVRKIMASCLHVLAEILGPDITSRDLIPLFQFFLQDMDEVKAQLVKNLFLFIKHLERGSRSEFFHCILSHLAVETGRNWRMRKKVVKQLIYCQEFLEPPDVCEHILPMALSYLKDKVWAVRQKAIILLARILKRLPCDSQESCHLIAELQENFGYSNVWRWRQMYVYLCQQFAKDGCVPCSSYGVQFGRSLLCLARDDVPNVKISMARCLLELPRSYMATLEADHCEALRYAIEHLQEDDEEDVSDIARKIHSSVLNSDSSGEKETDG